MAGILKRNRLHTICQSARCPNVGECWEKKTATFLLLGDTCTRNCGFCAVRKGDPLPPERDDPHHIAEAVVALDLDYAVITSVTRDDLGDGGASFFAQTIREIRAKRPGTRIEVLVPDFGGNPKALETVLEAAPDILNHNLETVEALYPRINRPRENYHRSLGLLSSAQAKGALTKSGLMLGLGETEEDILSTCDDLARAGCALLTIGQYLQPTPGNAPVEKYYSPAEFARIRSKALDFGFLDVVAGPLVRSSYEAGRLYDSAYRPEREESCVT